jgi:peptidyl-prolyl cis-trans isomerase SurA
VERTRFRETTHSFRQKSGAAPATEPVAAAPAPAAAPAKPSNKKVKAVLPGVEKPGKKEKIRYGQKPRETLPDTPSRITENAGALPENTPAQVDPNAPANPLESRPVAAKSRYSTRARLPKQPKPVLTLDNAAPAAMAPAAPDAAEAADRQTQAGPLGLAGNTAPQKKKKHSANTGDKQRLSQHKKDPNQPTPQQQQQQNFTPVPTLPGAPAPADHPNPATTTK